jgi:hypothetical protein
MQQTISASEIQETKIYKSLENCLQNILLTFSSKKQITYGLTVFKNTGVIPSSIGGNTLKVVKELIESKKGSKI